MGFRAVFEAQSKHAKPTLWPGRCKIKQKSFKNANFGHYLLVFDFGSHVDLAYRCALLARFGGRSGRCQAMSGLRGGPIGRLAKYFRGHTNEIEVMDLRAKPGVGIGQG